MPNQSDPHYTDLGFKIDHEKKIIMVKQLNPNRGDIIRLYRIKINRIISSYIEGPFGFMDDENIGHHDTWRFVITVQYPNTDHILCEKDIVLMLHSKELAEDSLDTLNEMIGM